MADWIYTSQRRPTFADAGLDRRVWAVGYSLDGLYRIDVVDVHNDPEEYYAWIDFPPIPPPPRWRTPEPIDIINAGKDGLPCRVRASESDTWKNETLTGVRIRAGEKIAWLAGGLSWEFCEVMK